MSGNLWPTHRSKCLISFTAGGGGCDAGYGNVFFDPASKHVTEQFKNPDVAAVMHLAGKVIRVPSARSLPLAKIWNRTFYVDGEGFKDLLGE